MLDLVTGRSSGGPSKTTYQLKANAPQCQTWKQVEAAGGGRLGGRTTAMVPTAKMKIRCRTVG